MQNYVRSRQQRIVLNGQTSFRENVLAGVPQEAALLPLFFWAYINGIHKRGNM